MARVGTRGAGLSKDIALSVKNKLTNLGANVSDDLARLSGKVEDAFAYADGAVSKNIGKHNARVYQSNGGNWDEVASGILGGSGTGRKAAAEFSDDASQALAKHGDEVSQALKETGEQAGKHASAEFGGETSQALSKHGDEVSQALKETGEQAGKHASAEFGGEASEALAKHDDEVNQALKETGEQAGKKVGQEFSQETSEQLAKRGDEVAKGIEEPIVIDDLSPQDIPTVKSGNFEEFFNRLTPEQLDEIWDNKHLRRKIERQLRAPGGMHEWHLVSRAPQFKRWGIQAEQIRDLRTAISDVKFVNPTGVHGGLGSTRAHNELLGIIDSSLDYETFVRRLNNWANYRLDGGIASLPEGLRSFGK